MGDWFRSRILETGRLPLFCFFVGMLVAFAFIRLSVRMIRAQVKWWPGNVTPGGVHIHHVVFGTVFMLAGGVGGLAIHDTVRSWESAMAAIFGVGSGLVLDEFALILHLDDVYWSEKGRTSVDAVFVAVAITGLLVLGVRPAVANDFTTLETESTSTFWIVGSIFAGINLLLATITLLKGKIWTGLLGLFIPILLIVGAIRLARPESPWAHWRYRENRRRGPKKLAKAAWRESKIREPLIRAKIWFQDFIAGSPNRSA